MTRVKKYILRVVMISSLLYIGLCVTLYFYQEHIIFFPNKIPPTYTYDFEENYQEVWIDRGDVQLNGALFKAENSKGLIFFLHGNGGSIAGWGKTVSVYTDMNYDVFILDYRGYGKSEGEIQSQDQFLEDIQVSYNQLKQHYDEEDIIVLGYSIGTGPATWLAANNQPEQLVLQAPYYSLKDVMKTTYPFLPTTILRYPFPTYQYLSSVTVPITIFHGNQDKVIHPNSSDRLAELFKSGDLLIKLSNQGHNRMTNSLKYLQCFKHHVVKKGLSKLKKKE